MKHLKHPLHIFLKPCQSGALRIRIRIFHFRMETGNFPDREMCQSLETKDLCAQDNKIWRSVVGTAGSCSVMRRRPKLYQQRLVPLPDHDSLSLLEDGG